MSLPSLPDHRPVPIQEAFQSVENASKFLASIVVLLVGYGVVTGLQGDALVGLLGAIPGVVGLVGDVIKSFRVRDAIARAESEVTPLDSPATVVEGRLVPLIPDPYALPGQHRAS